jgi:hypothetical protein
MNTHGCRWCPAVQGMQHSNEYFIPHSTGLGFGQSKSKQLPDGIEF